MMIDGKNRAPTPVPGPLCRSFAPLLPVLDDLADARLADDTREHLAGCAWCRAQRASYERFDEALRQQFAPEAMPSLSPLEIVGTGFTMSEIQEIQDIQDDGMGFLSTDDAAGSGSLPPHAVCSGISNRPPRRSWRMATGAASLAAVLIFSLLAGMIFLAHGRSLTPTGKRDTATPTVVPGSQMLLTAIGMASPTDGWAFALNNRPNGNTYTALHYTGGKWAPVQANIGGNIVVVKMLSPNDGWAIGDGVYHYDGKHWQDAQVTSNGTFTSISIVSPVDIWIGGGHGVSNQPLIYHYDGHFWTMQAIPTLLPSSVINGIAMTTPTDGWAVGASTIQNYGESKAATGVILRYHNGVWNLAQTLPGHSLATISMGTANDGWIGGDSETVHRCSPPLQCSSPPMVTAEPALWHYTGGKWVEIAVPKPAESDSMPDGEVGQITMFSAAEGWITLQVPAPQSLDGGVQLGPDIYQLRQGHWVQVQMPTIQQRRTATMNQIAFVAPDEFWGVGADVWSDSKPTVTPLLAHYRAGNWTLVAS